MSFDELRNKLASKQGKTFWKSLDQVAETEEFKKFLADEFPGEISPDESPENRRHFLKIMGASLLMGGLAHCKPVAAETIVPYVKAPEYIIPGKPSFFATGMVLSGTVTGLLVESHMGRPTKIEGNPDHPDSLGATNPFSQASVLGLYDPDRAKFVKNNGQKSNWKNFTKEISETLLKQSESNGDGLRILTEAISSPTLARQIDELLKKYPKAKWYQYDPINDDHALQAADAVFGKRVTPLYAVKKADIVVSFGADFMSHFPGSLRYAKDFMSRRRQPDKSKNLNRLYVAESQASSTGSVAEHRLAVSDLKNEALIINLAQQLGLSTSLSSPVVLSEKERAWVDALAKDLKISQGKSLLIAGREQSVGVHGLTYKLNELLGNAGKTVSYIESPIAKPAIHNEELTALTNDLNTNKVNLLIVLGGNPVYNAPANLQFKKAFLKAKKRVRLGLYEDETSTLSDWFIPETHYLENFSDAKASDGTVTMIQPLIAPLYDGKSAHELVAALTGFPDTKGYDVVRDTWRKQWDELSFGKKWQKALHLGLVTGTAHKKEPLKTTADVTSKHFYNRPDEALIVSIQPDHSVWDGRFVNNAWLQELPRMMTTLTWDNAILISPKLAEKEKLKNEDMIRLTSGERKFEGPVLVIPGQAENVLTIFLGYGRTNAGQVAEGVGFDAYPFTSTEMGPAKDVRLEKTGLTYKLAITQNHSLMEGRNLIRHASIEEFMQDSHFAHDAHHGPKGIATNMYPGYDYSEGYSWGMSINLNACTGCNACVVACQSENNIPTVGKKEILNGREMHWVRIDRYYEGDLDNPSIHHQPVMCMHCENAPCEPVCPVGATTHSNEGLNEMTYNRCVGTRYCANNCPYKVRKFNFFEYANKNTETLKMQRNPDVTVRSRGVMEKCTFCVQRINSARIESKKEKRKIHDGEIKTACQSSCPTEAIVFGDLNTKDSAVSKLKTSDLNYALLAELNTFPRLTYMAKVTNPNSALISNKKKTEEHHGH
jgi:MoCo/4Fe-4S cofactor protein with predicted Tat translocation signal